MMQCPFTKKVFTLYMNNMFAHHSGDLEIKIVLIFMAMRSHPAHFAAHNNLGNAQAQAGLYADAKRAISGRGV